MKDKNVQSLFLLLLALRDSKTNRERSVKVSFFLYLAAFTAGCFLLILYAYFPRLYTYISSLTLAVCMFTPVLFYRLAWMLTDTGRKEPFPYFIHFSLPVLLSLTFIIWSVFIPFPIKLDLIMEREVGLDYNLFSLLFKSKLLVGGLYVFVYVGLALVRLANDYRAIHHGTKPAKCPTRLMLFIAIPFFMLPLLLGVPLKTLRAGTVYSLLPIALNRKLFEEYFREHKPYLNCELRITDLIEPLKANRTVISNFVNRTYGINFNRYINRLRIKEMERLRSLPANKEKEIALLLPKAGFSSMRNYSRALAAEQDNQQAEN